MLSMATTIHSQSLSFGIRTGINSATVNVEDESGLNVEPESRTGLDIGLMLEIGLTEDFSIQPEIHYMQKGFEQVFEILGDEFESELSLNYLEIPILAKYSFGSETVRGFVNAGPSLGYALSGKTIESFNGDKEETDLDFEEEEFSRLDFSFALGGGIGFKTGPATIFVDVRYLLGLSNLDDSENDTTVRNRGLGFAVGAMFPLGE